VSILTRKKNEKERRIEESCFMGNKEETHEAERNMNMKKKLYNQQGSYGQYSSYSKRERKRERLFTRNIRINVISKSTNLLWAPNRERTWMIMSVR
jgi:hypothetical protein